MTYLTTREKSKATTKPWFSRLLRHPARKRSGSILGHKTHTYIFTYLLTFSGPTRGYQYYYFYYYYYRNNAREGAVNADDKLPQVQITITNRTEKTNNNNYFN